MPPPDHSFTIKGRGPSAAPTTNISTQAAEGDLTSSTPELQRELDLEAEPDCLSLLPRLFAAVWERIPSCRDSRPYQLLETAILKQGRLLFDTTMSNQVQLMSSDNVPVLVERDVIERSVLLKNMIDDLGEAATSEPIPIQNINEAVLRKVIEWCTYHKGDPPATNDDDNDVRKKTTDIDEWDQKFMQVDQEMLFEIILAANYLDIKALLDVGCKTVANMIKGKSPEEIRKTFNIQNDFTPEEEDQIRRENEWAEE
ncbi:hypothetical protein EPUS_00260 [Endocarpon pusillum Z07020]|uniref:E3 ubiquitin ligase complex SCF subunit sconC n=1 Tax=Endocarpon pusillum (strain Z07020 / HMAS-L-300199) TaxID=1263415 RepID=U1GDC4_ENDPU|nr:uncharacterized protein EPUS_00260 [Endocarpon pusillum Z07020]ERF70073.1 hypothetical protein EPUS_00260 [Endocarpon pusillum Z07020]